MSFFFQAEDGIRDVAVTGVQTCALPIYRRDGRRAGAGMSDLVVLHETPDSKHGTRPEDRSLSERIDRKSTRLNSSHGYISYAVFCLKKKNTMTTRTKHTVLPLCCFRRLT